jgi:hypothetical protein
MDRDYFDNRRWELFFDLHHDYASGREVAGGLAVGTAESGDRRVVVFRDRGEGFTLLNLVMNGAITGLQAALLAGLRL